MPPRRAKRPAPAEPTAQLRRSKRIKNQNSNHHRILTPGELYREINVRGLAAPTRRATRWRGEGRASASRGGAQPAASKGRGRAGPTAGPLAGPATGRNREGDKGKGKAGADVKGKGKARVESAESAAAAAPPAADAESPLFVQNGPFPAPNNPPDDFPGFYRTPVRRGGPSFLRGTSSHLASDTKPETKKWQYLGQNSRSHDPSERPDPPRGPDIRRGNGQDFPGPSGSRAPWPTGQNPGLDRETLPWPTGQDFSGHTGQNLSGHTGQNLPGHITSHFMRKPGHSLFVDPLHPGTNFPQTSGPNFPGAPGSGMFESGAPGYPGQTRPDIAGQIDPNSPRVAKALQLQNEIHNDMLNALRAAQANLPANKQPVPDDGPSVPDREPRSSDNRPESQNHGSNFSGDRPVRDPNYHPVSTRSDRPTSVPQATSDIVRQEASIRTFRPVLDITPTLGAFESPTCISGPASEAVSASVPGSASTTAPVTVSEAVPHRSKVEPETVKTTAPVAEVEDGVAETIHASASNSAPTSTSKNIEPEDVEAENIESENDSPADVDLENVHSEQADPEEVDLDNTDPESVDPQQTKQPEPRKVTGVIETTVAFYADGDGEIQGGGIKETFVVRTRDSVEEGEQEHEAYVPDSFSVSDGGFSCGEVEAEEKQIESSEPIKSEEKQEYKAEVSDSFSVSDRGHGCGTAEPEEKQTKKQEHEAHLPDIISVSDGRFSCGDVEAEGKKTEEDQEDEADVPDSFSVSDGGFGCGDVVAEEKQTEISELFESEEKQNVAPKATVEDESDKKTDS